MSRRETNLQRRQTFEPKSKRKFEVPSSELKRSRWNMPPTMRSSPSPRQYRASYAKLWPLSRTADQRNRKSRIDYRLSAPYDSNRICRPERSSLPRPFRLFITGSGTCFCCSTGSFTRPCPCRLKPRCSLHSILITTALSCRLQRGSFPNRPKRIYCRSFSGFS